MARKSAAMVELEQKYARALEAIDQLSRNQAMMSAQLGATQRSFVPVGQLVVGLRNVSNYSVGLVDSTSGQTIEYNLNPEVDGVMDPKTRAVVSYAFWQQLRKSSTVSRGLVIRDDSVLGPTDNVGPEDRPQDFMPETFHNVVDNPRDWVLSKTEQELRDAVSRITSEPTLKRLLFAVDQEILRIGEAKYLGDEQRAVRSIRDLPAMFRLVEELAEERLDELNPVTKVRHLEINPQLRMAR